MKADVADIELQRLRDRAKRARIDNWQIGSKRELEFALERADWQVELTRKSEQGTIVGDERNVITALRKAPELRELVCFNEFSQQVQLTRSPPWRDAKPGDHWLDTDDTACQGWLQERGITVRGRTIVGDCIALVAKDNLIHPVRDYLESLAWDGKPRLSSWLVKYLGAQGGEAYLWAVGRCWLISAIARIMKPGCKADHVLVLEGPQGNNKSMAIAALAVRSKWFCDTVGDLRSKDSAIQLCGKWIIELSELTSIRAASQVEAVKAYLSRTQDTYRPPYGRRATTVPRQTVFVGTTNERQYLRDRTGNRRFWPVRCTSIDLEAIGRDRDQLWAEARQAFEAGEQWWLTTEFEALAANEQDDRRYQSEMEQMVAEFLEKQAETGRTETTARDVFIFALGLDPGSDGYADQTRRLGHDVAAAMEAAGWHCVGRKGKGDSKRTVYRRVPKSPQDKNLPSPVREYRDDPPKSVGSLGDCSECRGQGCDECGGESCS